MQTNDRSIKIFRSFVQCLESKAFNANQKEQSFLTYLMHDIVLCVYPEKYTPLRVRNSGYPDLCVLLRAGYVTHIN